jgi:hypothetical protein
MELSQVDLYLQGESPRSEASPFAQSWESTKEQAPEEMPKKECRLPMEVG